MCSVLTGRVGGDYVIGIWAFNKNGDQKTNFWYYSGIALSFCVFASCATFARSGVCQLFTLRAGREIHNK